MKELVLFLTKPFATLPDRVTVTETEHEGVIELRLTAAEEDKGRIIGKMGKVIKALRAVVSATASKLDKKAVVSVD